jgi:hypothetical protein
MNGRLMTTGVNKYALYTTMFGWMRARGRPLVKLVLPVLFETPSRIRARNQLTIRTRVCMLARIEYYSNDWHVLSDDTRRHDMW